MKATASNKYLSEWFGGAVSSPNCQDAQIVEVTSEENEANLNFQLDVLKAGLIFPIRDKKGRIIVLSQ